MLSVIIPVYNAKKSLRKTVNSVLNQDFKHFEIILIDDGSTDGSEAICDELAQEYAQVNVAHKPNGGVSSARNLGLKIATGEFITFVDADDEIAQNMLSDIAREFKEKHVDMVLCGFKEIQENGHSTIKIADLPPRKILGRDFVLDTLLFVGCSSNSYMNSVWGRGYKKRIIKDYGLRFEDRPMGEDWLFNMKYCDVIDSFVYIDNPYYIYVRNRESATSRYEPKQFELWLENRLFRKELIRKYKFNVDQNKVDTNWIQNILFYSLQVIENDSNYKTKLLQIYGNQQFKEALFNTEQITPIYFKPVYWLIKKGFLNIAINILKLYSYRLNY